MIVGLYTPLRTVLRVDTEMREGVERGENTLVPRLINVEGYTYRHAAAYLACGPAIVAEIEAEYDLTLPPGRVGLVPHGLPDISTGVTGRTPGNGVRVLFVGRLESRKGIDLLLESIAGLASMDTRFHLAIVGDDTLLGPGGLTFRQAFERTRPDLLQHVTFRGRVDEGTLRQEYADCDIFVAPSRFESFGLTLIEAMIFGKPVVSADIGGMNEIVEQGKTGLRVPPGDIAALTAALSRLIESPELRTEMGRRGRRAYDEHFTVRAMAIGAETFYRHLARQSGSLRREAPVKSGEGTEIHEVA